LRNTKILSLLFLSLSLIFISDCESKLPLNTDITNRDYTFYNQDSTEVNFQKLIKGHIVVIGFIYTHCPDVCPMTTHNMYLTQDKLKSEGINNVKFISVTFDPNRDFPSILKKYAEIRDISFKDWTFLWGDKKNIDSFMYRFDITFFPADTTYSPNGEINYYMMHTDRISLVDSNGRLRKNYRGSRAKLDELFNDIKYLGD
jgi:protein SCO1/2